MHLRSFLALALIAGFGPRSIFAQGPLTPPGPPAPSMRALDEVEPRVIINAANCPGNSSCVFEITAPGSYYFTSNLAGVSGKNGINVSGSNITIDLRGFTFDGGGGATRSGVFITGKNVVVRDGTISNWGGSGITYNNLANTITGTVVERVRAMGNGFGGIFGSNNGIEVSNFGRIEECVALNNNTYGFVALDGAVIRGCIASGHSTGFRCLSDASITDCASYKDAQGFFAGAGTIENCTFVGIGSIAAGSGTGLSTNFGVIRGCKSAGGSAGYTVFQGTLSGCVSGGNLKGFVINGNASLTNCLSNNDGDGFTTGFQGSCVLTDCVANGAVTMGGSSGSGFLLAENSVLTDCVSRNNLGQGFDLGAGSVLTRCHARFNTLNGFVVGAGGKLIDCEARSNKIVGMMLAERCAVQGAVLAESVSHGLVADVRCVVTKCTASKNGGDGLVVGAGSQVSDCFATQNGPAGANPAVGSGIRVAGGAGSRLDGNNARDNARYGIEAGLGDTIVRNTAGGNAGAITATSTVDYSPSTSPNMGPISTPMTASSPWANF